MKNYIMSISVDTDTLKQAAELPEDADKWAIRDGVIAELGWASDSGIIANGFLSEADDEDTAKYFLREVKIRDGEREYYSRTCFTAESKEKAQEQADHDVLNFYQENQPQEDGGAYHCFGEVHVSLYRLEEISKHAFDILQKYS